MDIPASTWPGQLRYWSIHCGLTALPSFCIALTYFNTLASIAAMLAGVATFVMAYTAVTASPLYGKIHGGLVGRSVRLGTRIRMIISLVGLPLLIPLIGLDIDTAEPAPTMVFTADFWFGYAALLITAIGGQFVGLDFNSVVRDSAPPGFLFTYLTTIVEGLLISVSLVLIAFFSLIILNARQKRRVWQPMD
ncbi:MAG: hypothetical protein H7A51_14700 [Akkermansiaceae bacterium]|nr:hypothetical protein [Akkermansiaceae bacterium]